MAITRIRFRVDTTPDTDSTSDLNMAGHLASNTSTTSAVVDDGTDFEVGQNIKMNSEEMTITAISTHTLTVIRAVNGTSVAQHNDNVSIFKDDSPTYTPTQNPNVGTDISKVYDGIKSKKSLGGKTYTFANHESSRIQRKLVYENITEANKNRLVALFDYAKGQKTSFQYSEDGTPFALQVINFPCQKLLIMYIGWESTLKNNYRNFFSLEYLKIRFKLMMIGCRKRKQTKWHKARK